MVQNIIKKISNKEKGMATSEYAVGTVGACTVGGAIYTVASSDWFQEAVQTIFERGLSLLPF